MSEPFSGGFKVVFICLAVSCSLVRDWGRFPWIFLANCGCRIFLNQGSNVSDKMFKSFFQDISNRTHVSRTPKKPEYLIARSLATYWTGSVGNRSHSIFGGKNILSVPKRSPYLSGQLIQAFSRLLCWAGILRVILEGGDFDDWQLGGHDFDWRNWADWWWLWLRMIKDDEGWWRMMRMMRMMMMIMMMMMMMLIFLSSSFPVFFTEKNQLGHTPARGAPGPGPPGASGPTAKRGSGQQKLGHEVPINGRGPIQPI